jgi:acyl transferase domain-containing protein/acyl carrier protein
VARQIAFVFSGQGSQYAGMGKQLYETQPVFKKAMDQCAELLAPHMQKDLLSVLYPAEGVASPIDETEFTQPCLFAFEYSLAQLWMSWGVEPAAVMGHSVGEYVAACVAGVFSLEDGCKLIAARGKLMQSLPKGGTMAAVFAGEDKVRAAIASFADSLAIAAVNGPTSVVISGKTESVESVIATLAKDGIKAKNLNTSHAFHSPLMAPMLAEFEKVAKTVTYSAPTIGLVSTPEGVQVNKKDTIKCDNAKYWIAQISKPVLFDAALQFMLTNLKISCLLEIGAAPVLTALGRQIVSKSTPGAFKNVIFIPSLGNERQQPWASLCVALGILFTRNAPIDWSVVYGLADAARQRLPLYPFQRQRFWVTPKPGGYMKVQLANMPEAPALLTARERECTDDMYEPVWSIIDDAGTSGEGAGADGLWVLIGEEAASALDTEVRGGGVGDAGDAVVRTRGSTEEQVSTSFAAQLVAAGGTVVLVTPGAAGTPLGKDAKAAGQSNLHRYTMDPSNAGQYRQLLQTVAVEHDSSLISGGDAQGIRGVVHMSSLSLPSKPAMAGDEQERSKVRALGSHSLLLVTQAMMESTSKTGAKLWVVTRGTQAAGQILAPLNVNAAPLWGLGTVTALENPMMVGGMIDLGFVRTSDEGALLCREICSASAAEDGKAKAQELKVAIRAHKRLAPALMPAPAKAGATEKPQLQSASTCLVTGGLGALGMAISEWLIGCGCGRLVLTSRRGAPTDPSDPNAKRVAAWKAQGVDVIVMAADVCDRASMQAVLDTCNSDTHPLRGIVHAAGVLSFRPLKELTTDELERVLAAKVHGGWLLHSLTTEMGLGEQIDLFVLYSSISAVWGAGDMAHYAAANSFLDALAHHRRYLNLPALAVNWSVWGEIGMINQSDDVAVYERMGLPPIQEERALRSLGMLLGSAKIGPPPTTCVVATVDWKRFKAVFKNNPFFDKVEDALTAAAQLQAAAAVVSGGGDVSAYAAAPAAAASGGGDASEELENLRFFKSLMMAPVEKQAAVVLKQTQIVAATIMGLSDIDDVDPERPLTDLGLDSLMAVEFGNALSAVMGAELSATLSFDYPTVTQVVAHLLSDVLQLGQAGALQDEAASLQKELDKKAQQVNR